MTLRDYWEILRHSWLLILGTTLAAVLAALGLSLLMTPVYQATSQLFVSVQSSDDAANAYSGGLYVQARMKSYVVLADSPGVLDPVIRELGLATTSNELADQVTATNPTSTVLLNVSATDTDPEQAAAIADATAESLATEIVRLETTESGAKPVTAEVIRPAEVPTSPISPRLRLNLVLAALLGLMVGAGIAVLRHVLDTTVKSSGDLEVAAQATCIGTVAFDPSAKANPLVTLSGTPRAEAFRSLRTNLRYVDVDNPPRSVVITSSLPGEGKTTTACNLAIALAQDGSRVLLVEADLRLPRVADYLGVDGSVGLTDVLIGQMDAQSAILSWQRGLLDFLPSGAIPPNPSELLGSKHMVDLLAQFARTYDIVVIDSPPLLPVTDAAILARVADGALLVTRHGSATRENVADAADHLSQAGARLLGTVLNFTPERKRGGYGYGYGYGGDASAAAESGRRILAADEVPSPDKPV